MNKPPRWLQLLGILAVGFVFGRWTADTQQTVVSDAEAAMATQPIEVELVSTPVVSTKAAGEETATEPVTAVTESQPVIDVDPIDITMAEPSSGVSASAAAGVDLAPFAGTWYAETSHGPRLSKLAADGTGVIDAKLDWVAAIFYGSRLTLNVDWVVDAKGETMIHTVTSGAPTDKVAALTRDYGAIKEYRVDSLSDDTMVLVDPGDGEVITWHRRPPGTTMD